GPSRDAGNEGAPGQESRAPGEGDDGYQPDAAGEHHGALADRAEQGEEDRRQQQVAQLSLGGGAVRTPGEEEDQRDLWRVREGDVAVVPEEGRKAEEQRRGQCVAHLEQAARQQEEGRRRQGTRDDADQREGGGYVADDRADGARQRDVADVPGWVRLMRLEL